MGNHPVERMDTSKVTDMHSMRRAIVIGGSSGMGAAFARHVTKSGGEVLICSRSEEKLEAAKALHSAQERVSTQVLDNTLTLTLTLALILTQVPRPRRDRPRARCAWQLPLPRNG